MKSLFLASQSMTRRSLLDAMGLPYSVVPQWADEQSCDGTLPLEQLVMAIAHVKMDGVEDPLGDYAQAYVITADTLCQAPDGTYYGKPQSEAQAVTMITAQRDAWVHVATGVVVEERLYKDGTVIAKRRVGCPVSARVRISIRDDEIEAYLSKSHALMAAGAMVIDGYGAQFLQAIEGSYSAVLGLPLYELRDLLRKLGYFG